jgi:hypothetical protein
MQYCVRVHRSPPCASGTLRTVAASYHRVSTHFSDLVLWDPPTTALTAGNAAHWRSHRAALAKQAHSDRYSQYGPHRTMAHGGGKRETHRWWTPRPPSQRQSEPPTLSTCVVLQPQPWAVQHYPDACLEYGCQEQVARSVSAQTCRQKFKTAPSAPAPRHVHCSPQPANKR